jgi:hypothetical protein
MAGVTIPLISLHDFFAVAMTSADYLPILVQVFSHRPGWSDRRTVSQLLGQRVREERDQGLPLRVRGEA